MILLKVIDMILNETNYLNYDFTGKIIIFPTDTVYGIGCLYDNIESIKKIYEIKNRDYNKPMVILCANLKQVTLEIVGDSEKIDAFLSIMRNMNVLREVSRSGNVALFRGTESIFLH